jgi:hypothetical protein
MRLMLLVAWLVAVTLMISIVRRMFGIEPPPRSRYRLDLSAEAKDVMRLAEVFADRQEADAKPVVGHLLLALASRPGEHLKVLPNATVLACDIRTRVGLATSRHRLISPVIAPSRRLGAFTWGSIVSLPCTAGYLAGASPGFSTAPRGFWVL